MKKFLLLLAALVMLLTSAAMADAKVEKTTELERSIMLCAVSNCYVASTENGKRLFDANGNALSAEYKDIRVLENGEYLRVQNTGSASNINCLGLLDAQGREILPMAYGAIATYHGDGWVLAHVLAPAGSDVGEYKDNNGNQYIISRTDVLYKGQLLGSLSRNDYNGSCNVYTHGPNLLVKMSNQKGYWLTSSFQRMDVTDDSMISTAEFVDGYNRPVIHNPTQQEAFTASCTLTPDQVEQHLWFNSGKRQLMDLQGNVVATLPGYTSAYFYGKYFEVRPDNYRLKGVMDLQGKEIIPPVYKEIGHYLDDMFPIGYNAVMDEQGNLYFYDTTGKVTASAEYQLTRNDYNGFNNNASIIYIKNMGKIMIVTATHGTLPETYDEARTCGEYQPVIAVRKGDHWGVIDMAGNEVVPFVHRDSPTISRDGTLIYGVTSEREHMLYNISYGEQAAAAEIAVPAPAPAADGAWTCTCGAQSTGKFCGECGQKKPEPTPTPADDGAWTCSCGSVNTGKFCPECGSKKPEAPVEPQCASCGYKPEGAAPKFCPECGTKF